MHKGVQNVMRDLNNLNKNQPALYEKAFSNEGFEWVAYDDAENSVISYLRKGNDVAKTLLVVINMTPAVHHGYEIGVNQAGVWQEILNTDAAKYGGSGTHNVGKLRTINGEKHGRKQCLSLSLAPLSTMIFELVEAAKPAKKPIEAAEIVDEKPKKSRKKA
jgi:1,4-alpha-glucan branching enzyme